MRSPALTGVSIEISCCSAGRTSCQALWNATPSRQFPWVPICTRVVVDGIPSVRLAKPSMPIQIATAWLPDLGHVIVGSIQVASTQVTLVALTAATYPDQLELEPTMERPRPPLGVLSEPGHGAMRSEVPVDDVGDGAGLPVGRGLALAMAADGAVGDAALGPGEGPVGSRQAVTRMAVTAIAAGIATHRAVRTAPS